MAAVIYAVVVFFARPLMIPLIGGSEDSYPYIYNYMFWTMVIGAIPTLGNALSGHLVRSIGAAKEAGFGLSMGGILNIILDPLFMFVLLPRGMEVTGAAIATCLSNTIALTYFLVFLYKHRDNPVFTFSPADFTLEEGIPGEVFSIGTAAALQTFLAMVSNIFANKLVVEYGSAAVAGMGIAKKVDMIAFNTTMGLTQRKEACEDGTGDPLYGSSCAGLYNLLYSLFQTFRAAAHYLLYQRAGLCRIRNAISADPRFRGASMRSVLHG